MATKTLKEISIEHAKKQPKQVEYLTEKAPILESMPFEAASHEFWNSYEEVTDVSAPTLVKMDSPLPAVDTSSDLKRVDLDIFGGKIERGEDAVKVFGGFPAYLAKKEQAIFRKFGMDAEKRVLYSYFLSAAIAANNVKDTTLFNAGGSANTNYTMLVVRYEPGVTVGLYNPKGFAQGAMLNYTPFNGGTLYTNAAGVPVYGGRYKSYFGVQIASPTTVAAIVNIDRSDADPANFKIPTAIQIDDAISAVRGSAADTFIYCHPDVITALGKYKEDRMEMTPPDKDFDRNILRWGGVPFFPSYNFLKGSEANQSV